MCRCAIFGSSFSDGLRQVFVIGIYTAHFPCFLLLSFVVCTFIPHPYMQAREKIYAIIILSFVVFITETVFDMLPAQPPRKAKKYYISASGKDSNPGTMDKPWQTIQPLNQLQLHAGDMVCLEGGKIFKGPVEFNNLDTGTLKFPVTLCSYGNGEAVIDGGYGTAIHAEKSKHLLIKDIILRGSGRKRGNTGRGIFISNGMDITIDQVDISGFQKSGVELENCSDARVTNIFSHDNGFAGIAVTGDQFPKFTNHRVYIGHCRVENNPGDPTVLNNHSGNGIVVGLAQNVTIEYCVATNNGWDMPRKGNGPVGIWAWEADSVIIQHCISFRNRTAPGAMDGGGFDLDGGVTNSLVQYNLSYENEGYAFGLFQFSGATPWHHNTFRYNVSFNDGNKTIHGASILWWNGSKDSSQFHDCFVYNNVLYNSQGYTLGVIPDQYENTRFFFLNNIFVAKDEMMTSGKINTENFYGNDWWSLASDFKMNDYTNFLRWINATGKEKLNGKVTGMNIRPDFMDPIGPAFDDPDLLQKFINFQLSAHTPLRDKGLNLTRLFHIDMGKQDFLGNGIPKGGGYEPGAYENF